jgi:calcineurin-like phosphoesterase family protein
MDEVLIKNWNSVVSPHDTVYHLGDFCFPKKDKGVEYYLNQLNGHIHMIWGNHDKEAKKFSHRFESVQDYKEIYVNLPNGATQFIVMFHYSIAEWNKCHRGSWHLWGHSHNNRKPNGLSFDVGVDCWDYKPVTIEQLMVKMDSLKHGEMPGHHGRVHVPPCI